VRRTVRDREATDGGEIDWNEGEKEKDGEREREREREKIERERKEGEKARPSV